MLPLNLYARVHFVLCKPHARPRVQRAPGIPCALFSFEGEEFESLGRDASRECEGIFSCHRPPPGRPNGRPMTGSGGRSSIPETLMIRSRGRGVLDPPLSRRMTAVSGAAPSASLRATGSRECAPDDRLREAIHR